MKSNKNQIDCDNNGIGDSCDSYSGCYSEIDNDNLDNDVDNCDEHYNPDQFDRDGDGIGDMCDYCQSDPLNDIDGDGVCGNVDNCPTLRNPNQFDSDNDGYGNSCDACINDPNNDIDNDGVCGDIDNCPYRFNPSQSDCDFNRIGDACDSSSDCVDGEDDDGIIEYEDNCPETYNPQQLDIDKDGIGDMCDLCRYDKNNDADQDGYCRNEDNCFFIFNPNQADTDKDGIGDACDICPYDPNNDIDEDSICGNIDNCPNMYNPNQESCNNTQPRKEVFNEVVELKKEKIATLLKNSYIENQEEVEPIIEKSSEVLKENVKVEKKKVMKGNKEFTKYRITVEVDEPLEDIVYYQNLPKCLADNSENIYFNGKNYNILETDPIIAWHFKEISDTIEMSYDVEGDIPDDCMAQVKDFIYSTKDQGFQPPSTDTSPLKIVLFLMTTGLIVILVLMGMQKRTVQ